MERWHEHVPNSIIFRIRLYCLICGGGAIAQTQHHGIGGFDVLDIGGVSVLKDPDTNIIDYFNLAVSDTKCAAWSSNPDGQDEQDTGDDIDTSIGGVEVEFTTPGFYEFEYLLKPFYGDWAGLSGAQVVILKGLDIDSVNTIHPEEWQQFSYEYKPSQKVIFNIREAGEYVIGFGPYDGTLLAESQLDESSVPNGTSIRFRLERFLDPQTMDDTGFKFNRFVDLSWSENDAGQYLVNAIAKTADHIYEEYPSSPFIRQLQSYNVDKKRIQDIVDSFYFHSLAGAGAGQPLGRNAEFAVAGLDKIERLFTSKNDFTWNDESLERGYAAKLGLYSWRLQGETETSLKMINNLLDSEKYLELLDITRDVAIERLPTLFPDYQY